MQIQKPSILSISEWHAIFTVFKSLLQNLIGIVWSILRVSKDTIWDGMSTIYVSILER